MADKRLVLALTLLILGLYSIPGQAKIYRWTDANGEVHFSDQAPPVGGQSVRLPQDTSGLGETPQQAQQTRRVTRALEEDRIAADHSRAKHAAESVRRKRNCNIARERLATYRNVGTIYQSLPNGSRRALTDAQRSALESKAAAAVNHWCGND